MFRQLVDDIYGLMTRRASAGPRAPAAPVTSIATPLQRVGTNLMSGMMETLCRPAL